MNNIKYLILLYLLGGFAGMGAQEAPEISEEGAAQSAETEAPLAEDAISESSGGSETVAAEALEVEEEVEQPEKVKPRDLVIIGSENSLGPNQRSKDMVTIGGNSFSEGHVDGDMVTIWGDATLLGYVDGNFVVIMGSAELGPGAEVDGSAVVIGGKLNVHPTAKIDQKRVNIPFFVPGIPGGMPGKFQDFRNFIQECVMMGRPISPNVPFTLYLAGIFLLFYLLLAVIFPKPLERCRIALKDRLLQSFLTGILTYASWPLFLLLLAITLIGLVLVPFAQITLIALTVFGKAVVFLHIGKQIGRAINLPALEHALLSIILGGIVVYPLYMIPFFGIFLWLLLSILGLGAVVISIIGSISKRKEDDFPAPDGELPPPQATKDSEDSGQSDGSALPKKKLNQPGAPLSQVDSASAALFGRVGFWWRTLATLIDLFVVGAIVAFLDIDFPLIPLFAYFIIFWGWKGSALGGMALGIRVQKISGEPLDWPTSFIRSFCSAISFIPFLLGFFWAGWDPEKQSWHDKIAGTTVVRIPPGYTWN